MRAPLAALTQIESGGALSPRASARTLPLDRPMEAASKQPPSLRSLVGGVPEVSGKRATCQLAPLRGYASHAFDALALARSSEPREELQSSITEASMRGPERASRCFPDPGAPAWQHQSEERVG